MNKFKSSAELKATAKTHMFGKYKPAIGAYVLMNLILMGISMLLSMVLPANTAGQIISYIAYILIMLISGIFESGSAYLYLNIICDRPVNSTMIFYGFKNNADKALLMKLCLMIMELTMSIPFIVFIVLYIVTDAGIMILFTGLGAVLALVGIVYIELSALPLFYLLHDFPNHTVRQLLSQSRSLMRGSMGRALYLWASLIPMQLLSLLSLGIGSLWVEPYRNATFAEFFMDLIKNKKD